MTTDQAPPDRYRASVDLGPYVAWLASRVDDESTRRRCRQVAQAYLEWAWADGGPASTRRSRFIRSAAGRLEITRPQIDEALDRLAEHRAVVAQTMSVDGW